MTSRELTSGRIEDEEVIRDGRKRHDATETEIRHIDEEAKVPHIGDERGKALALKGWGRCKTEAQKNALIATSRKKAEARLKQLAWPILYWGVDGLQKPVKKVKVTPGETEARQKVEVTPESIG